MRAGCNSNVRRAIAFGVVLLVVASDARAGFRFGVPRNLGPVVNSTNSDGSPELSADGLSLYFDSGRPGGQGDWDIWVTTRTPGGDWGKPVPLPAPVNSPYADSGPSISADGLSLYFGSNRFGSYGSYDLWVSTRKSKDAPWGTPVNLGSKVNSPYYDNHPSISADGLSLYFDSMRPGGQGYDVWVTTRKTTQHAWGTPVNLGPVVNTGGIELSPSIHSGGLVLFFDSRIIDRDIWMVARRTPDDPWGPAVNPGAPVNTPFFDTDPCPAPNESMLYFASDRPGGVGGQDLWEVPVIPIVDFNGDGVVDLKDFSTLAQWWQQCEASVDVGPTAFGDGIVDTRDVAVLAEHWLEDNRLIGRWSFDETAGNLAKDKVGGHDGTVQGSPMWRPQGGKSGGAIELNGTDAYLATNPILNPADGPFSVFVWVKGGAGGQVILSQAHSANWLSTDAQGRLMTELKAPGRLGKNLTTSIVITDGVWHRIGLAWDGSNRILYVDDVEVAKDTQPSLMASTYGLNIGAGSSLAPGTYWSGLIDDLRLYNRAVKP
jgi:Tol biopolymer transport system component